MYFISFCVLFSLRIVLLSFVLAMIKRWVLAFAIQSRYCAYVILCL